LERPTTPVQSDTEFEVSQREKAENIMTHSASWKWGELPTHEEKTDNTTSAEAKRNSKLSNMFSFMKQTRKQSTEGQGLYLSDLDAEGMDPEVAAMYFPPFSKETMGRSPQNINEEDRESGNGTSLPQSPSSMELIKSVDSDYDEVKLTDKYLDFVALSLCGGLENGGPSNEDFDRHRIEYSEVSVLS
jgi:phosphatidate phosphatase LPIN